MLFGLFPPHRYRVSSNTMNMEVTRGRAHATKSTYNGLLTGSKTGCLALQWTSNLLNPELLDLRPWGKQKLLALGKHRAAGGDPATGTQLSNADDLFNQAQHTLQRMCMIGSCESL
jgi:hypothetical protein